MSDMITTNEEPQVGFEDSPFVYESDVEGGTDLFVCDYCGLLLDVEAHESLQPGMCASCYNEAKDDYDATMEHVDFLWRTR